MSRFSTTIPVLAGVVRLSATPFALVQRTSAKHVIGRLKDTPAKQADLPHPARNDVAQLTQPSKVTASWRRAGHVSKR